MKDKIRKIIPYINSDCLCGTFWYRKEGEFIKKYIYEEF